jgi:hypothetical protein
VLADCFFKGKVTYRYEENEDFFNKVAKIKSLSDTAVVNFPFANIIY